MLRTAACWELGYGRSRPSCGNVRRAVRSLLRLCGSGPARLCLPAANALVGVGSKMAVVPLIGLLRRAQSPAAREAAAYALGFLGDKRALVPLISTLENTSEHAVVRAQAAEAIGELALTSGSRTKRPLKALISALRDRSAPVRFWACYGLSQYRDRRAISALRKVAKDRAFVKGWWSVGREARWAIAVLRGDPQAEALWDENAKQASHAKVAMRRAKT